MNGIDGFSLCSQSLRRYRFLLGAPFPQSEFERDQSLTGLHRSNNKAIERRGSTGKLRQIHAEQRSKSLSVRFAPRRGARLAPRTSRSHSSGLVS